MDVSVKYMCEVCDGSNSVYLYHSIMNVKYTLETKSNIISTAVYLTTSGMRLLHALCVIGKVNLGGQLSQHHIRQPDFLARAV